MVIWVVMIGIPHWRAGDMGPQIAETWTATLAGVILVPIVIPGGTLSSSMSALLVTAGGKSACFS